MGYMTTQIGKKLNKPSFTLVEVMIVVAIIIILASLSIHNLLRARLNANEAYAVTVLRRISTACENYRTAQTQPTYPTQLADLSNQIPPYLTTALTGGSVRGYTFNYAPNLPNQYTCTGSPVSPGATGVRTFVVNESGLITSDGVAVQ